MAFQNFVGGMIVPHVPHNNLAANGGTSNTSFLMDASGEKVGMLLCVPKTGTLHKVSFLLGTVSSAQDLKVSFQDIDLGTGDPDGSVDQYRVVSSGSVTSNAFVTTGILSSDGTDGGSKRSVTAGDHIYVVIEFNATVGTINVVAATGATRQAFSGSAIVSLYTGSWAKSGTVSPIVMLEYSDGSKEPIMGCYPFSSRAMANFASNTTSDEKALKFKFPFPVKVSGAWFAVNPAANATWDMVLYDSDGSTIIGSKTGIDEDQGSQNGVNPALYYFSQGAVTLTKDTYYYLAIKPLTATTLTIQVVTVDSAAVWDAWDGGQNIHHATRTDAGAWTAVTTERPMMGLIVSAFDDAVSAGGLLTHPGMSGGMRG